MGEDVPRCRLAARSAHPAPAGRQQGYGASGFHCGPVLSIVSQPAAGMLLDGRDDGSGRWDGCGICACSGTAAQPRTLVVGALSPGGQVVMVGLACPRTCSGGPDMHLTACSGSAHGWILGTSPR